MDFATLTPEINSGRMYAGPGSGPMLAAAAAWDALAAELHSAAAAYGSVISGLTAGPWLGSASMAMAAAAAPFGGWMRTTAVQAEQTAAQAKAAAAAYEVTFAAMVPPPVIAANRALLQALVATNLFGQNTPAIGATEAHYAEMWAQDAAAMLGYAGASASASTLTPFTPAPPTTKGAPAAANMQTAVSQATSTALQGLAAAPVTDELGTLSDLESNVLFLPGVAQAGLTPLNTTALFVDLQYDDDEDAIQARETHNKEEEIKSMLVALGAPEVAAPSTSVGPMMPLGPAEVPSVTAALGRAPVVGSLSVPPGWTAAAPAMRLAAVALPTTSLGAIPEVFAGGSGSLFSQMALASMAGRALGGPVGPGRQERIGATTRGCPAPSPRSPDAPEAAITAEIRARAELLCKLGELRDSGILTNEEFNEQKRCLLGG
jgi:PPE-repeat protein